MYFTHELTLFLLSPWDFVHTKTVYYFCFATFAEYLVPVNSYDHHPLRYDEAITPPPPPPFY